MSVSFSFCGSRTKEVDLLNVVCAAAFLQTWDQPPARGYEKPF